MKGRITQSYFYTSLESSNKRAVLLLPEINSDTRKHQIAFFVNEKWGIALVVPWLRLPSKAAGVGSILGLRAKNPRT